MSITVLHVMKGLSSYGGTPRKLLTLVQNSNPEKVRHVFLLFLNDAQMRSDEIGSAGGIVENVVRPRNWDVRLLFDIMGMVRKYKVDIINTHFARSDIYGIVAGLLCGIPVIKSVHGMFWNGSRVFCLMDKFLAPFRYMTICNSYASLEAERARSRVKKGIVVHNGVVPREELLDHCERELFRCELSIPPGAFVVGHVGGLIGLREQHITIDAVNILAEGGMNVCFVLVGDGPERNKLENQIDRLAIGDRVRLLGYRDDMAKLLSVFDVYVNMASAEGFGIAVVEAMFAGVPVVLANAGAHPELIVDGESGILVPAGNSQGLADALTRLAEDSSFRRSLGEGGRKRANEKFTISRFARDFQDIYETCVKETRKRVNIDS